MAEANDSDGDILLTDLFADEVEDERRMNIQLVTASLLLLAVFWIDASAQRWMSRRTAVAIRETSVG